MENQSIRLNKFLAERLGCSRREADDLIQSGKILINKDTASVGTRIDKNDKVWYNGKIVPFEAEYSYLLFNKPVGYVCSRHRQGDNPTIYSLLPPEFQKLKTVGRLDKDSSGLILFTNDGDFAYQMTHPKFRKTKVYEVELDHSLEPLHQQMISDYGVMLEDGVSRFKVITTASDDARNVPTQAPARAEKSIGDDFATIESAGENVHRTRFTVVLTEGRNRQIRRTFAALGYKVVKLHRVTFGKYELGDLVPGRYVIIKP